MDSPLREPRPIAAASAGVPAPRRLPLGARNRDKRRAAAARVAARTTHPLTPAQRARDPLSRLRNPTSVRWWRGLRATLGSIAVHAAVVALGFLTAGDPRGRREQIDQAIKVEVREPPPLAPEPPQVEKAEPRPAPPKVVKATPKPPPPPEPPAEQPKSPPTRVVGISMESTTEGGGGPAFAVGNTRQGTTADRAVKPEEVPTAAPSSDEPAPGENKSASRLPSAGVKYTPPRRRREVKPIYPPTLKAQGIEADVKVSLSIDATGKITAVKILTPAAYPEFNDSAKAAGLKEDFEPATRDGNPIPYSLPFTYKWRLQDE